MTEWPRNYNFQLQIRVLSWISSVAALREYRLCLTEVQLCLIANYTVRFTFSFCVFSIAQSFETQRMSVASYLSIGTGWIATLSREFQSKTNQTCSSVVYDEDEDKQQDVEHWTNWQQLVKHGNILLLWLNMSDSAERLVCVCEGLLQWSSSLSLSLKQELGTLGGSEAQCLNHSKSICRVPGCLPSKLFKSYRCSHCQSPQSWQKYFWRGHADGQPCCFAGCPSCRRAIAEAPWPRLALNIREFQAILWHTHTAVPVRHYPFQWWQLWHHFELSLLQYLIWSFRKWHLPSGKQPPRAWIRRLARSGHASSQPQGILQHGCKLALCTSLRPPRPPGNCNHVPGK